MLLKMRPIKEKIGYFRDELGLILIQGMYGAYLVPEIYSVHVVTGKGVWSSLNEGQMRAKVLRGWLRNAKTLPEFLRTFNYRALKGFYGYSFSHFCSRGNLHIPSVVLSFIRIVQYKVIILARYLLRRPDVEDYNQRCFDL